MYRIPARRGRVPCGALSAWDPRRPRLRPRALVQQDTTRRENSDGRQANPLAASRIAFATRSLGRVKVKYPNPAQCRIATTEPNNELDQTIRNFPSLR
jgi:hypothetical protein